MAGDYEIGISATDDGDGTLLPATIEATLVLHVLNTNRPPELSMVANLDAQRGEIYRLDIDADDPDGNPIALSLENALPGFSLPSFMTFEDHGDGTGQVLVAAEFGDRGDYPVTVIAQDNGDGAPSGVLQDQHTFVVSVHSANEPPMIQYVGDVVALVGEPLEFEVIIRDEDSDELVVDLSDAPDTAELTSLAQYGTFGFSWTPTAEQLGSHGVVIDVKDSGNGNTANILTDSLAFTITVRDANSTPVLAPIGNQTVQEGDLLQLQLRGVDTDGDSLTYHVSNLPQGAHFNAQTGLLVWTPNLIQAGAYSLQASVSDGNAGSQETFLVEVTNQNQAPRFATLAPQIAMEGQLLVFPLAVGDFDGDPLHFSSTSVLPAGAQLDSVTGSFRWTPEHDQQGTHVLTFNVADPTAASDSVDVIVTVNNVNRPPVLSVGSHGAAIGSELSFHVAAEDPDRDTVLHYSAEGLPSGATIDPLTGQVSWLPTAGQAGRYAITYRVSDGLTTSSATGLLVAANPQDTDTLVGPSVVIELTPSFALEPGETVRGHVIASSLARIDSLTLQIQGPPVTLDAQGRFTFVPGSPGRYEVSAQRVTRTNLLAFRTLRSRFWTLPTRSHP